MRTTFLAVLAGAGALFLTTVGAMAEGANAGTTAQCGDRAKVVERLATAYGETRRSVGLSTNRTVMEVYASEKTGSWTITATLPNGLTCLVASGEGFEAIAETLPAAGFKA